MTLLDGPPRSAPDRRRRPDLSAGERRSVCGMALFVILLHVAGWGVLVGIVAPQNLAVGTTQVFGVGLGVTAYILGMRHAFDADHIAAIDNTTRKLMGQERRPLSVGFWFSLGHSSVVLALSLLLAAGVRAIAGQVSDGGSLLQTVTGAVGTTVSGTFLLAIGLVN